MYFIFWKVLEWVIRQGKIKQFNEEIKRNKLNIDVGLVDTLTNY